jgi:hypothetical protein
MKTRTHFFIAVLVLLAIAIPQRLAAQATGRIDFTAHATPTDGRPEPVREMTFYLSNKSLADVRAEAGQRDPVPDLNAFVDSLTVSPELKAWMKKHQTVELSGGEFTKLLTADDIVDIPEIYKAYMSRNDGFEGIGFPKPKYKEKEATSAPEKYKQQKEEYKAAIKKFITVMPESIEGIDADLADVNPYEKWARILNDRNRRLEKMTLDLAQRNYAVKQTDTDIEGRGSFADVAPGDYWIGTLGTQAIAGDTRIRWDLHVTVRAGEVTHANLTNLNAAEPLGASSIPKP